MKKNMRRFSELDGYKIHKKDQDVHDWIVRGDDNHVIGQVNDLIVDMEGMKVVYIEVSLSDHFQKLIGRPVNVLLPMDRVEIDRDAEEILTRLNEKAVMAYPAYEGKIITPAYLFKIQNHYDLVDQGTTITYQDEHPNPVGDGESRMDNDPVFNYELSELRVKFLELKKELKIAQAEKEIAVLERDIAIAQVKRDKLEAGMDGRYHHIGHK